MPGAGGEKQDRKSSRYTGEQTGAFIPFRMCDQNTTVPRRAAHSHFDWTSVLVKWEVVQFWIRSGPIMKCEPLSYLSIKSSPFLDGHHVLLCKVIHPKRTAKKAMWTDMIDSLEQRSLNRRFNSELSVQESNNEDHSSELKSSQHQDMDSVD